MDEKKCRVAYTTMYTSSRTTTYMALLLPAPVDLQEFAAMQLIHCNCKFNLSAIAVINPKLPNQLQRRIEISVDLDKAPFQDVNCET
ncbi:hypothetical protein KIN20_028825 [Parelaphostrongylus tenuis]|uniref:Uncharacterized protein n=1 Tax=Parelaphostrongylus tenuis TaxID=148309 RepID=A0AAD5R249_PARTN|nr:hypothetical protein KIN20_028825 [Parelaphostrongylus tenuis]